MTSSGVVPGPWQQEIERTIKELEKAGKRYLDRELDGHINTINVLQEKLADAHRTIAEVRHGSDLVDKALNEAVNTAELRGYERGKSIYKERVTRLQRELDRVGGELEEAIANNDRLTKVIGNNQGVNKQAYDNGHKAGYAKGVEAGRQCDASASNEAYAKGVEVGARAVTQRIRASWLQLADELREIDPADIL